MRRKASRVALAGAVAASLFGFGGCLTDTGRLFVRSAVLGAGHVLGSNVVGGVTLDLLVDLFGGNNAG